MERLTINRKLPPKGYFMSISDEEMKKAHSTDTPDTREIYTRLQAYEDTGFTPEEIKAIQEDNARLHKLLDELETIFTNKSIS